MCYLELFGRADDVQPRHLTDTAEFLKLARDIAYHILATLENNV